MRFYEINLYSPDDTSKIIRTWSSFPGGSFDPNALDVEFDCPVVTCAEPIGGASIRIHGIAMQDLMQSRNFGPHYVNGQYMEGCVLELKGGMGKGLPLANPPQQGTLLVGQILQSFGQWEGTEMWLDFVVTGTGHTLSNPGNIVLNWTAGQPLQSALQACLSQAYKSMKIQIEISPNLVLNHDEPSFHGTLEDLGRHLKKVTQGMLDSKYPGVDIAINAGVICVYDGTQPTKQTQIQATDLVGQPTWLDTAEMQLKVVLRGDVQVGQEIIMPKGFLNGPGSTINQSGGQSASSVTFSGPFGIHGVRHIGHFRSTSGTDWVTVLNCHPLNSQNDTT